jgi:hypothetical protein
MHSHTGSSYHFRALLIDWTAAIGVRRATLTLGVADLHLHDHQAGALAIWGRDPMNSFSLDDATRRGVRRRAFRGMVHGKMGNWVTEETRHQMKRWFWAGLFDND